jgi:hypothetical protein
MKLALASLLSLLLAGWVATANAADATSDGVAIRRFALIASSNDGGTNRARLRFANSDAESIGRVLGSLGGVRDSDLILVREATRDRLRQAFAELKNRMTNERRAKVRSEVFVYYSGHSDEDGLLLGGERVGYRELRQWIDDVGADVRIAILDSCASGSLIRLKGGVHRAPFLSDVSIQARGHAFLTASSADEAAQESDRVGAAFFTHYLLSGMRGAADANRDQRVTLNEAYQFAYNETLQRTEASRAGAQHPAYDIQLAGTGDLVMTDLHASSSHLVLARELAGRIYVRDGAGRLVAELRKDPTYPVELGLDAGLYRIVVDHDGQLAEGSFDLQSSGRTEVASNALAPMSAMLAVRRGDEPMRAGELSDSPAESPAGPDLAPAAGAEAQKPHAYREVGFDLVLAPGYRMSGESPEPVEHHFLFGVLGHSEHVRGAQVSLAGNISRDGVVGAQVGGMLALSYGTVEGVQAGGYNMALGGLRGAQLGWLASVARGPVTGAQVAMVNVAHGSVNGAQVGIANIQKGDMEGAQIGLVNIDRPTQKSRTAQIGFANISRGEEDHSASKVGFVNISRKQKGLQVGLVNVAEEMDGVQIGLVSIARKNTGASISILPIILDGDNRLILGWDSTSMANLGFKLGTRRFYVTAGVGITNDSAMDGRRECASWYGFGVHAIPRGGRWLIDADLVSKDFGTVSNGHYEDRHVSSLRLLLGFAVAKHLMVMVGPSLNLQVAEGADDRHPRNVSFAEKTWTAGDHTLRMFPGFTAGLEF